MALIKIGKAVYKQIVLSGAIVLLPGQDSVSVNLCNLVNTSLNLSRIHIYKHSHLFNKHNQCLLLPSTG